MAFKRKPKAGPVVNFKFVLTRQYSVNAQTADEAFASFRSAVEDHEFDDSILIVGEHVTRIDPVESFAQKVYYLDDDGAWILIDDRPI
jgi:hypothetical protein